jgi:hypothetical protein
VRQKSKTERDSPRENRSEGRRSPRENQSRISVRNANTLARIGSTLLRTVPGIKTEFKFSYSFDEWNRMLQKSGPLSSPDTSDLSPATPSVNSNAANLPISINGGTAPSEVAPSRKTEVITQTKEPV